MAADFFCMPHWSFYDMNFRSEWVKCTVFNMRNKIYIIKLLCDCQIKKIRWFSKDFQAFSQDFWAILKILWRFPKFKRIFPIIFEDFWIFFKIVWRSSEGHVNVAEHFPKSSEDFWRLRNVSEEEAEDKKIKLILVKYEIQLLHFLLHLSWIFWQVLFINLEQSFVRYVRLSAYLFWSGCIVNAKHHLDQSQCDTQANYK